ncbi:MAG: response regulator [Bacilli bacterium]|nr:response regulator [Bacilli bacterium]
MQNGLSPAIVSLSILMIIFMIYDTKEKINNLQSKLFNTLTYTSFLFCLITLLYSTMLVSLNSFIINLVFWRTYNLLFVAFWEILLLFLIIIIQKYKNKTMKDLWETNILVRVILIVFTILEVILLLFPHVSIYEKFDFRNITFTSLILSILSILISLSIIVIINVLMKKNKEKLDEDDKKSINMIIYCTLFVILQVLMPSISIYAFSTAIITSIVYLTYANPDIEITRELSKAQKTIKDSAKTKTDFLSNVTSEIKTPVSYITSLCTNLENLEEYNVDEVKKTMNHIILSGNNLLEIVNNVLDISKIESGNEITIKNEYNIKNLIDDISGVVKSKLGQKNVTLEVNLSGELSSVYEGDVIKIYQVLQNVLTNAAKYTEVGKITFDITSTKLPLGEKLLFKIADTGNGIKPDDQDKLFKKGTRLESSIDNEIEGAGYGLSITKEYLDLMEGKIWFESEYQVGTTFYIEIPQKVINPTPLKELIKEEYVSQSTEIDCENKVALVVDDNKLNNKVIKRLLERYKFKVVTVSSGQDCIYKVKSEEKFDIIFMDQVMPDMSGIETMKALRGLDGYELPPLISLTANAVSGMKEHYLGEGFDEYLSKPINTSDLEKILTKYFKKTN